jgi:hypothetical protein
MIVKGGLFFRGWEEPARTGEKSVMKEHYIYIHENSIMKPTKNCYKGRWRKEE